MKYSLMLFSKFFNSLFLLQRANKQLSVLLGYDIAIQALNYNLVFIDRMSRTGLIYIIKYDNFTDISKPRKK